MGRHNKYQIAKNYIIYRDNKKHNKKFELDEEKILTLIDGDSELRGDNANKHIDDNGSVRDYIAGIKCKTIAEKLLPKEIVMAHKNGFIPCVIFLPKFFFIFGCKKMSQINGKFLQLFHQRTGLF